MTVGIECLGQDSPAEPAGMPVPALRLAKQERFANLVAAGVSVPEAYTRAGYTHSGPPTKSNGFRLMGTPSIRERIEELKARAQVRARRRFETEFDDLLLHADAIARSDIGELELWLDGGCKLADLPDSVRWAVSEVRVTKTRRSIGDAVVEEREDRRVKLHDKLKGLELLGKELGGFLKAREESGVSLSEEEVPLLKAPLSDELLEVLRQARFVSSRVTLPAAGAQEGG